MTPCEPAQLCTIHNPVTWVVTLRGRQGAGKHRWCPHQISYICYIIILVTTGHRMVILQLGTLRNGNANLLKVTDPGGAKPGFTPRPFHPKALPLTNGLNAVNLTVPSFPTQFFCLITPYIHYMHSIHYIRKHVSVILGNLFKYDYVVIFKYLVLKHFVYNRFSGTLQREYRKSQSTPHPVDLIIRIPNHCVHFS